MTDEEKQQRWMAAWRVAGPELNRIREEELRQKDEQFGLASLGAYVRDKSEVNGLITFQSWMMRLRVIELNKRLLSKGFNRSCGGLRLLYKDTWTQMILGFASLVVLHCKGGVSQERQMI